MPRYGKFTISFSAKERATKNSALDCVSTGFEPKLAAHLQRPGLKHWLNRRSSHGNNATRQEKRRYHKSRGSRPSGAKKCERPDHMSCNESNTFRHKRLHTSRHKRQHARGTVDQPAKAYIPGEPGAEVSEAKKNCIAKEEFAYRMCAGRPTCAMPRPRFLCASAFSRSVSWWRFGASNHLKICCGCAWQPILK